MKVWTDKYGNKLTGKEFISRWKSGIQKVDALQQTQLQISFTWIVIIGITLGLVAAFMAFDSLWWLMVILLGALGNTGLQQLALYQKLNMLEKLERRYD